ncbi:MAG TPA: aminotransferase class III-fold pyridoxal phosphate-dependent enzyme, partial [Nitrosopumilaceae archaeon]|nr:aminotransferase class III-fold pyridoxal phosphate-dependent enzyme [Nitrosopumilaceae archaeon]
KQFEARIDEIKNLDIVGDVRHKGMLMGIELVSNKRNRIPIKPEKIIHQKIFSEAKKHNIYLRTLGHIVMLVPPLAISTNELEFLLDGTIDTIKKVTKVI